MAYSYRKWMMEPPFSNPYYCVSMYFIFYMTVLESGLSGPSIYKGERQLWKFWGMTAKLLMDEYNELTDRSPTASRFVPAFVNAYPYGT